MESGIVQIARPPPKAEDEASSPEGDGLRPAEAGLAMTQKTCQS